MLVIRQLFLFREIVNFYCCLLAFIPMLPYFGVITYSQRLPISIGKNPRSSNPLLSISPPCSSASSKIYLLITSLLGFFPYCFLYQSSYVPFYILRINLLLPNMLVLSCLLHILYISILPGINLIFILPFLILLIQKIYLLSRWIFYLKFIAFAERLNVTLDLDEEVSELFI